MFTDFIVNGRPTGAVADRMGQVRWDPGFLRPYYDARGERRVTINNGFHPDGTPKFVSARVGDLMARGIHSPVMNSTMLSKEQWIQFDQVAHEAAHLPMRAWKDLASMSTYGGFNGMGKMLLEYENISDSGEAQISLDGIGQNRQDKVVQQLEGLPLPIIHSDFSISLRKLTESRNSGMPLDTRQVANASRRCAEMVERLTIGVETGPAYGGASTQTGGYGRTSAVYGYLNFPSRLTKINLTTPTGSNPSSTVADVLAMRQLLMNQRFFGPYMLYHSTDWDTYMDNDYILTGGNVATETLRNRLRGIEGIQDVRRLDFLQATTALSATIERITTANPFTLLMVQMTPDVARAVNGLDLTVVQWEEKGGMELHFKVMCINVPQLFADYYGRCGICQGTTS